MFIRSQNYIAHRDMEVTKVTKILAVLVENVEMIFWYLVYMQSRD